MRIVAWNILHGGGAARLPEIILSLLHHQPDVVLLTEFRPARGSQIRAALADHGLEHQFVACCNERANGMLLASRGMVEAVTLDGEPGHGRWLAARLLDADIWLGCVHAPDDTLRPEQAAYWQFLLKTARAWRARKALLLGDFNTCRAESDGGRRTRCAGALGRLASLGFADAWRSLHPEKVEYSWYSHDGAGWRIDAAFVSAELRSVLSAAAYSQTERAAGQSDHALLSVDLGLSDTPKEAMSPGLWRRSTIPAKA